MASKLLQQIRNELANNELLKKVFPDILYQNPLKEAANWSDEKFTVKRRANPKESTCECQGLLSLKTGAHYQLMIFDDVITINSVSSPEMVAKINEYIELSLSLSKEGGVKRFIGTRYSYADSYQFIIDKGMVEVRVYAATEDGTINGKPVLFSEEYWNIKKIENSASNLGSQYLQNPLIDAERRFNTNDIMAYEIRPTFLNVYILCDPAKSKKTGSANSAILVIGIAGNKRKYLLDGYCHRMNLAERWTNLKNMYTKWKASPGVMHLQVGYETYGSGSIDIEYFKEQMKKENGVKFIIKELESPLNSSARKIDRIERIEPDLRFHNIFIPYPTDQNRLTKSQLRALQNNCEYLVSKKIKQINESKKVYDLSELFLTELDNFPFGKFVDCIDAFSRIYDMDIMAPNNRQGKSYALPEDELT